jgi:ribosomal peptide maturation radical SAM protein 1
MFEIVLINMPFADIHLPSLALTQLKYVVEQAYPGRARARILYLNHEFTTYLGAQLCQDIGLRMNHHTSGFGDWLFRQAAFPDVDDNAEDYFLRYYPRNDPQTRNFREFVREKRAGIREYFDHLIGKHGIADAQLVGFTSMFSQNVASFALASRVKHARQDVTVVLGGANCEHPMGEEIVRHVEAVDYVFSGPALIGFPQFVGNILDGSEEPARQIPGVFSKRNTMPLRINEDGTGGKTVTSPLGEELDINAPIPLDYNEFLDSFERYSFSTFGGASLTFETSRGCWWGERAHCTFCGLNGMTMKYRSMTPAAALEQFRDLFAYSAKCIQLQSVDNILPKSYFTDVLPQLTTPENLSIFYEVKADLTEEEVGALAKARVNSVQPGIEALASSTLKLMKKGVSSFQNINLLKHCARHGVKPNWNLLVGFPGEKEEVFAKYVHDIPLLTHLPPPSGVFPVRFDRYSPYFTKAESYGLILRPYEYYGMTYPFPESALANLAYYFMDQNYEAEYLLAMLNWLAPMQKGVERWKTLWGDGDTQRRPRLEIRRREPDIAVVFDSRSGSPLEYVLDKREKTVLECLQSSMDAQRLVLECDELKDVDVSAIIDSLRQRKLLFEENGRLMSLILGNSSVGDMLDVPRAQVNIHIGAFEVSSPA